MKEDYLILEIRKIGALLQKLFGRLLALKDNAESEGVFHEISQALSEALKIEAEELSAMTDEAFIKRLLENKALNAENMDMLGDVLLQMAENTDEAAEKAIFYNKSLAIYTHLDRSTLAFSIDRQEKMQQIRERVNSGAS